MKVKILLTKAEQSVGLQYLPMIPGDTIYIFVSPSLGGYFHSRNVIGPFDLVFLSSSRQVLFQRTMIPPNDIVATPPGAAWALEAKPGVLQRFIVQGKFTLSF
jgi:uncharacterized membrane protein (UPF0127 family)